jgi:ligand-binding sensor domain-containing protein
VSPEPSPEASTTAPTAPSALPSAARLVSTGTYRLDLTGNRRPTLVAGAGRELWFVDEAKRLATIDTVTGKVTDAVQLPLDGTFTRLLVGTRHVLAIDTGRGRIVTFTIAPARLDAVGFPFVNVAKGFALGEDDTLWMAGGESGMAIAIEPGTNNVTAVDLKTSSVTALFVDTAGRVWFADDGSGGIGYYQRSAKAIVSVPGPTHSSVTALSMDRDGTLWVGTASGEVLTVRLGILSAVGSAGGSVAGLVRDASGRVWSYANAAGAIAYRQLPPSTGAHLAALAASSLAFDGLGRAWFTDPGAGVFYIALNGGD